MLPLKKEQGKTLILKMMYILAAGATVASSRKELFSNADIVLAVNPPSS